MHRIKFVLLGVTCVVGAAYASLSYLTGPQFIPPAEGRSAVRAAADLVPVDSLAPDIPQTPLDEYYATLNKAAQYLQSVDSYSATFIRQVRKDDELLDREEIDIKIRHEPFSVYMNWNEGEQQVLWVDGENDGKLLARRTRGLFRRTIRLGPTSRLAMSDSRYPIYELGMLELVLNAQEAMAACVSHSGIDCSVETTELDGLPVRKFTVDFASPEVQDTYSHCEVFFSEGEPMPVCITSYGWNEEGERGGLIEHYYYRDLEIDAGLTHLDFDAENEEYGF